MKANTRFLSLFLFVLVPSAACADSAATADLQAWAEAQRVAQRTAPIHRADQLAAFVQRLPEHSPLEPLSSPARARFVQSLRFNDAGLTTFDYRPLVDELSASQIRRLLALFGAERTLAVLPGVRVDSEQDRAALDAELRRPLPSEDYPGYSCVGRATCQKATDYICMSGC